MHIAFFTQIKDQTEQSPWQMPFATSHSLGRRIYCNLQSDETCWPQRKYDAVECCACGTWTNQRHTYINKSRQKHLCNDAFNSIEKHIVTRCASRRIESLILKFTINYRYYINGGRNQCKILNKYNHCIRGKFCVVKIQIH